MKKRFFPILLALALALSLLTATALASEGPEGWTADTSWYNEEKSEFTLDTAGELAGLAQLVNGGNSFSGKTITLGADIDLEGKEWTPIGKSGATFNGIFDGDNKKISNLTITRDLANEAENNRLGLFGMINSPAAIKNLTIENVDINGSLYIGAVVGDGYTGSAIENCHVTGNLAIDGWWYIGGISGNGYVTKVSGCSVSGNEDSYIKANNNGSYVGGIWGYRGEGNQTISDCTVENIAISGYDRTGGISGIAQYQNTIEGCKIINSTVTTSENYGNTGLIAGADLSNTSYAVAKILNCEVENTTATAGDEEVTTKVGPAKNDGTLNPTPATVGTDVKYENGKITEGTLEQVTRSELAGGLTLEEKEDGTYEVAELTTENAAAVIDNQPYATIEEAIGAAEDGDTVTINPGTYQGSGEEIQVTKAITIEGAGDRASTLNNMVFNIESTDKAENGHGTSGVDHTMDVTFRNLNFTDASRIKVGFKDMQNSVYETLETTYLTIDDCYANVQNPDQRGVFIYLGSTYNTNLDLTITDSILINSHKIVGEDTSPIVNGNGTNIVEATITGNTFGSETDPIRRYAVKFARRQDNTKITISDNTVYGTAPEGDAFYLLDLYQSGSNPYDDLSVTVENNTVHSDSANVYAALIEGTVVGKTEEPFQYEISNNEGAQDLCIAAKVGEEYYTTLQAAVDAAVKNNIDTVILLSDIINTTSAPNFGVPMEDETNSKTLLKITQDLTIEGNGHTVELTIPDTFGAADQAIGVGPNAALTLDNVKLTVEGTEDSRGDAFDVWAESSVNITGGSEITLNGLRSAFTMQGGTDGAAVTVTDSALTAETISGNFSNGGNFTFTNADVDISGCGSYGISANKLTVADGTTLNITGTTLSAIKAIDGTDGDPANVTVTGGSTVNISGSGSGLPLTTSKYGLAIGVVDLGHGSGSSSVSNPSTIPDVPACLVVDAGSAINMTGNTDQNGDPVNFAYLTATATVTNNGTVTEIRMEELEADEYRVVYKVQDKDYYTITVTAAGDVITFPAPADPIVSGYDFTGWNYGGYADDVQVSGTDVTITVGDNVPGDRIYTFTANLTAQGGSSGSSVTRYEVAVAEAENGTVTVSPARAARGRTVTITATPDQGYEVASVTVTGSDGSAVAVTDKGDGKFTFTMPRGKVSVEVTFQPAEEEPEPQPEGLPFTDVAEGDWYYDAVSYAWENDLMTGTSATLFAPNVTTTRAMLATLLWRLEGEPQVNYLMAFEDVAKGLWYSEAVRWASSEGVVTGVGDGSAFDPNGNITREQMAVMLYRYADYKGYDVTQGGMAAQEYADYESISSWAVSAVDWAVNAGLISGTSATTLTPQGSATRAEIATILMRFVETFVPAE